MSTQDKIKELAQAALRSAPPAGIPKPATFMPSSVKPAVPTILSDSNPAGVSEFRKNAAGTATAASKDEAGPELRPMVGKREEKPAKWLFRQRLVLSLCASMLIGGSIGWVWATPSARFWFGSSVPAQTEAGQDVRMTRSMMSPYDASLEPIGTHGDHIDPAMVEGDEGPGLTFGPVEGGGLSAASPNRASRGNPGSGGKLADRSFRHAD